MIRQDEIVAINEDKTVALLLLLLPQLADLSDQTIISTIEVDQLMITVVHLLERMSIEAARAKESHHRLLEEGKITIEALSEIRERVQEMEKESESLKDENLPETSTDLKETDLENMQLRMFVAIAIETMMKIDVM